MTGSTRLFSTATGPLEFIGAFGTGYGSIFLLSLGTLLNPGGPSTTTATEFSLLATWLYSLFGTAFGGEFGTTFVFTFGTAFGTGKLSIGRFLSISGSSG